MNWEMIRKKEPAVLSCYKTLQETLQQMLLNVCTLDRDGVTIE